MASKSEAFTEPNQHYDVVLDQETDRGCVLASSGFLDSHLQNILRTEFSWNKTPKTMIDWLLVKKPMPPLQSFYIKAVLIRAMGLISQDTFNALEKLNRLRNHFAHHPGTVALSKERVDAIFSSLSQRSQAYALEIETRNPHKNPFSQERSRFNGVVYALVMALNHEPLEHRQSSNANPAANESSANKRATIRDSSDMKSQRSRTS